MVVRNPDLDHTPGTADDAARPTTAKLLLSPATVVIFVVGIVIRLWVINTTRGTLSADEAYTGLQSAAILDGHFPIVIPGLVYTSPFDSYLMTPLTALFGQHVLILKLFPSLAWGAAACLLVAVVRRMSSDRAAWLSGAMLWLAPGALAVISTRAYQSYASGMATVVAATLAVVLVIELPHADDAGVPIHWRSARAGFLAGFAFYLHPMFLAVLLPLMVVPCWHYRRRLREWWLPMAGAALLANAPFLAWNARNDWPSLSQPAAATDRPVDRLTRFGTGLVERAYGVMTQDGSFVFGKPLSIVLLLALAALAVFGSTQLWRSNRRLWPIVVAPLTIGWGIMALFTNTAYVLDGRYAIITFPFVIMAVAIGADRLVSSGRWKAHLAAAAWVVVFSGPFLMQDTGTDLRDPNAPFRNVAALLESKGISRLSGFYWWVLPVELVSDQQIRVSVASNPYVVLLPYTQRLVQSTPPEQVAFLFSVEGEDTAQLRMSADQYDRVVVEGIVLYIPKP